MKKKLSIILAMQLLLGSVNICIPQETNAQTPTVNYIFSERWRKSK